MYGKIHVYGYHFQVAIKIFHGSNTFQTRSQTTFALRYTILYHRDPLATDDESRKSSTTLQRQPGGNNQVNDITLWGFPILQWTFSTPSSMYRLTEGLLQECVCCMLIKPAVCAHRTDCKCSYKCLFDTYTYTIHTC